MRKILALGCAVLALSLLAGCAPKGEKYNRNTASGYDYVQDNMKISSGEWSKNWVTSFDTTKNAFTPTLDSYKYSGLNIYLGKIHSRDIAFEVAKPNGNVYVETYLIYADETGAEVSKLLDASQIGKYFEVTKVGWNVKLDFDKLPPTTKYLKFKVQKGDQSIYLDAKAPN
jgi:hypothetical protein